MSEEFIDELIVDVIAIFLGYVLAKGLSLWNWVGALLALIAKASMQTYLLLSDWGNSQKLKAIILVNIILAFITTQISIGKNFISALFNILCASAMSSLYVMWGALSKAAIPIKNLGHTWVDGVDVGINLAIAGAALIRSIWLDQ